MRCPVEPVLGNSLAEGLEHWPTLRPELQNFRMRRNPTTGYEHFEAREGQHDDLVLALAGGLEWGTGQLRTQPGVLTVVRPNYA